MADKDEGKGRGYALILGAACLAFGIMTTWAGLAGAIPWWGAAGADGVLVLLFAGLMLRADWAQ